MIATWNQLREGHIVGIIDSYDAVHSQFTGTDMGYHEELWPMSLCKWRWCWGQSIYTIGPNLDEEQYESVMAHITKKYGIPFGRGGWHDIEFMIEKMNKEDKENKNES